MSPGTGSIPAIGDEVRRQLEAAGLSPDDLEQLIRRAVDEDLDAFRAHLPPITRHNPVPSGIAVARRIGRAVTR